MSSGFLLALAASLLAAGGSATSFGPRTMMAAGAIGLRPDDAALRHWRRLRDPRRRPAWRRASRAASSTRFRSRSPPQRFHLSAARRLSPSTSQSGALSAVVGPVLGGWLTDLGGWRTVFLAQLPSRSSCCCCDDIGHPAAHSRRADRTFDVRGVASASLFIASVNVRHPPVGCPGRWSSSALRGHRGVGRDRRVHLFREPHRRARCPPVRSSGTADLS